MGPNSQSRELIGRGLEPGGVMVAIEIGGNLKAGAGGCRAGEVEDLLIGIERLTGPVERYL